MKIKSAMRIRRIFAAVFLLLLSSFANGQTFSVSQTGRFTPQNKKVLLVSDSNTKNKIILFQTTLRVNTDGSPLSYHPKDLRGKELALNNICNAVAVRKGNSDKNLCFSNFSEAIGVFEEFRDSAFTKIPDDYRITWQNVLATEDVNGKETPCIFKSGKYKGYFGSLTALRNGITGYKGECAIDDQIDSLTIPALVLAGGENIVKQYGAKVGDLLVAYNPATKLFTSAIIGDTGPKDNLGEGSVLLNMKLLGITDPPANRAATNSLSINDTQILVAIIPSSGSFEIDGGKPFSEENIERRALRWQKRAGFDTPRAFIEFVETFRSDLSR